MTTVPQSIADTIVDPKAYADGRRVDEAFAWLRREAPLAQVQPEGYDALWPVTRHADILEIERQSSLFRNGIRPPTLTSIEGLKQSTAPEFDIRTLVQMDDPDHGAYRRLTQPWFLPQNIARLEHRMRDIARKTIGGMLAHGTSCDFVRDVALLYPLRVLMEILGVPEADEARMLKLTQELFGASDPDMNRDRTIVSGGSSMELMRNTLIEFMIYFLQIIEDRRTSPQDDLASAIANGEVNGAPLGPAEAMGYYVLVATAGHDTTSNTTATGMWALAERPELFRRLKNDPSLIQGLVEESIRWATPVKHFMRTASADAVVAGQKIARGDWLMLCYPSGNRDEAVFDDPFRFDITRTPNRHLAFGYGAHLCIGQHLARMEMRIFWQELLPLLAEVELDGTPLLSEANFVCGPKRVPLRFKAA